MRHHAQCQSSCSVFKGVSTGDFFYAETFWLWGFCREVQSWNAVQGCAHSAADHSASADSCGITPQPTRPMLQLKQIRSLTRDLSVFVGASMTSGLPFRWVGYTLIACALINNEAGKAWKPGGSPWFLMFEWNFCYRHPFDRGAFAI